MSRGKVVLDGQEYEIDQVLDSDSFGNGGRMVQLALTKALGPNDREVYKMDLAESVTEFNIGSMEKGSADTVVNTGVDPELMYLLGEVQAMDPGTAIVIVRRGGR